MSFYGGPLPFRLGGGGTGVPRKDPRVLIRESLLAARGTGVYDTSQPSNVFLEDEAVARILASVASHNRRLANQWLPLRLTDFLTRWESILGLYPSPTASLVSRRQAVSSAMARFSVMPTYQAVFDACTNTLGPVFVGIVHTTTAAGANGPASVFTPSGWGIGTSPDPAGIETWYSTVAHILVQVTQPTTMSSATFYQTVGLLGPVLDPMLPAWCTWNWFRNTHGGGATKGFYLDERNLNEEVFAV